MIAEPNLGRFYQPTTVRRANDGDYCNQGRHEMYSGYASIMRLVHCGGA